MSSSADRAAVVKLSELGDIVTAVPYMLGFQPAESLVVVSLSGPRERLTFTLRLDLESEEHDAQVATMLADRMAHARADQVLVVVYTEATHPPGDLPRRALVEELERAFPMPVRDAVLVTAERLWSYLCDDPRCCPPDGRRRDPDSPGSVAVAAVNALHGTAVLPSREAVVASVAPVSGNSAASMRQAIHRAWGTRGSDGKGVFRKSALGLAAELTDRYAEPPGLLSDDEAALLVVGLHDVRVRDELMSWCLDTGDAMRSLLGDVARRAQPPHDAPACTLLAWVSYLQGEGVVTMSALDRALTSDPDYRLAALLGQALESQLTPTRLRALARDLAEPSVPAPKRRGRPRAPR
jgi:hypothetical protein